jgi:predicted membrane chloride channel (bestrophin family)
MVAKRMTSVATWIPSAGSSAVLSYLAAPLGLLLTLRTNQSMNRLLEARQAWGRLTLQTRSLANIAAVYLYPLNPQAAILLVRHLAILGWVLKAHVRGESIDSDQTVVTTMLGKGQDATWLLAQPKRTNAITARIRQIVAGAVLTSITTTTTNTPSSSETRVSTTLLVAEEKVTALEQVFGICERLLTSPIPPTYTRHLSRTIFLWIFFLPASLGSIGLSTFGVVTATFWATYVLVGIDEVGMEIENCFQLLPLQQLSAAVQTSVELQVRFVFLHICAV